MPSGNVPPPTQHPDEEPIICVPVNAQWIPIILGALVPLKYPEYWAGTLEENRTARKDYGILIDQIMQAGACDMSCCLPLYVIQRINPDTGMVEVSTNNGATWQPQPDGLPTMIVEPIPPVTAGTASTKCDAVANFVINNQKYIDHVSSDFTTASDLTEFGLGIIEGIAEALSLILTGGALSVLEAAVIPIITAAVAIVYAAGKTAWDTFWDADNKKIVKCALYAHIGDNGAVTDDQFSAFWHDVNDNLPGGVAKILYMGFLSSIGRQGINNMAATGTASGSDCSDCSALGCQGNWVITSAAGLEFAGTEISKSGNQWVIQSVQAGDGRWYVSIESDSISNCCVIVDNDYTQTDYVLWFCNEAFDSAGHYRAAFTNCINKALFSGTLPYEIHMNFDPCP